MNAAESVPRAAVVSSHGVVIDSQVLDELQAMRHVHFARALVFVLLYGPSAYAAYWLHLQGGGSAWIWLGCIPFYLIAAASLHGISLFTHEGVHGVLSRHTGLNRAISIACALPVLQNYAAYKVLHLKHHKHLGQPGDPDHYDNYSSWTWLVFTMHWLRLIVGYPVYIVAIPILGYQQGNSSDRRWILFEVFLLVLLIAAVCVSPIPWTFLLHGWLIPMLIINSLVNVRGMSQHTFLEHANDPVLGTRSILTNPVTTFFMCNENYHLEHHLFPRVPWYNLAALHRTLSAQLQERHAPFVPSYLAFVHEFVVSSWRRVLTRTNGTDGINGTDGTYGN